MTTNCVATFIEVADNGPTDTAPVPPSATQTTTVSTLHYDPIVHHPSAYTSSHQDDAGRVAPVAAAAYAYPLASDGSLGHLEQRRRAARRP